MVKKSMTMPGKEQLLAAGIGLYATIPEQADIAYYTSLTDKDKAANAAWTKITTEAAKYIWANERTKVSKKR